MFDSCIAAPRSAPRAPAAAERAPISSAIITPTVLATRAEYARARRTVVGMATRRSASQAKTLEQSLGISRGIAKRPDVGERAIRRDHAAGRRS